MPLLALRKLITQVEDAISQRKTKEDLYLVNKLKATPIDDESVTWLFRNAQGGLSPLVSSLQISPVVKQGTYRQLTAGALETRHVKRFTDKELRNIMSPDDRFRISEKAHLVLELLDMERRMWETREYAAWQALALGNITFVSTDPASKMSLSVDFPVTSKTAAATFANAGTTIVTYIDAWIEEFELRYGKKPDAMRMTRTIWNHIKKNTEVKNTFTTWWRVVGKNAGDLPAGMITPEFVAKACDWPPIEIMTQRTFIPMTAKNNEAEGTQTVEVNEGTWGVRVGDTVLCKYDYDDDSWDYSATITAVTAGVSIAFTIPAGKTLTAGDNLVVKPTFFPEQYIQLVADETRSEFILPPYGIDYSGNSIQVGKFKGMRFDAFAEGREPNLAVYRRASDKFGLVYGSRNYSCKVIV